MTATYTAILLGLCVLQSSTGRPRQAPSDAQAVIRWQFRPSESERNSLSRFLSVVGRRPGGPSTASRARQPEMFRLGPGRYLMVAIQPRSGPDWGVSLFVLDGGPDSLRISPPLSMHDAEFLKVERIADFDADGRLDVQFCTGYEGEEELPARRRVSFSGGRWRALPLPAGTARKCREKTP